MNRFTLLMLFLLSASPFLSIAKIHSVPLTKTEEGHLEIRASINGVEAKFVLDSGATGTVIGINELDMFDIELGGTEDRWGGDW